MPSSNVHTSSSPHPGVPGQCRQGHSWGRQDNPSVGFTPCGCAGGDGHVRAHCQAPGCAERWYEPPHSEGETHPPGLPVAGRAMQPAAWYPVALAVPARQRMS
jgi:hypothetical protein